MSEKVSVQEVVDEYCTQLRRRAIQGSLPCARRTAELMRILVTSQKHQDPAALIDAVRSTGHAIQQAKPFELAIGNVVRRVLHIIREEAQNEALANAEAEEDAAGLSSSSAQAMELARQELTKQQQPGGPGLLSKALKVPGVGSQTARAVFASRALSLHNLLDVGLLALGDQTQGQDAGAQQHTQLPPVQDVEEQSQTSHARPGQAVSKSRKGTTAWSRRNTVIDAINEMIEELDNITSNITDQGVEHLHANEVILTLGNSSTACAFLIEAAKKREFQVIVAEGAPTYGGHRMARQLADAGIQTTVIADSAVFAMMARANKVIVGAHAVLANGGVIAPCGIHMVALAARQFSIPFVVLVGLHKLSPLFPHQPEVGLNEFGCPAEVLDLDMLAEAFSVQLQLEAAEAAQQQQGTQPSCAPDPLAGTLHIPNPGFDYIPPDLISLFITDTGGYTPSYVYRLLTEYYSREDYLLTKELLTRHH